MEFERVADVPEGGVLFIAPALLLYGLLDKSREVFSMPEGFYPLESIFLLLALMALGASLRWNPEGLSNIGTTMETLLSILGLAGVLLPSVIV